MKRIFAAVLICGTGSCIAADAATAKKAVPLSAAALKAQAEKKDRDEAAQLASMAPADEYFGPLKLSIIGISNTIRDIGLRYKYNHDLAAGSFASAQLSESAVRDWLHRYPHDPQLPRNVFFLQRLYSQILLQQSRDHAAAVAKLLFDDFASSPQAKQLKKTLAVEHLSPLPTPSPSADATVEPAVVPPTPPIPATQVLPQSGGMRPDAFGVTPAPASAITPAPYSGPTAIPSGAIVPVASAPASLSPFAATPNPRVSSTPGSVAPTTAPQASPIATSAASAASTTRPAPTAPATTLPSPGPIVTPAPVASGTPAPNATPGASPSPH